MITKPEDAVPNCSGAAHNMLLDQECKGEPFPAWFSAKECAEIAKAYLAAYLKEKRALFKPDREHKKAEADLRAWRKRFKEWENAT